MFLRHCSVLCHWSQWRRQRRPTGKRTAFCSRTTSGIHDTEHFCGLIRYAPETCQANGILSANRFNQLCMKWKLFSSLTMSGRMWAWWHCARVTAHAHTFNGNDSRTITSAVIALKSFDGIRANFEWYGKQWCTISSKLLLLMGVWVAHGSHSNRLLTAN